MKIHQFVSTLCVAALLSAGAQAENAKANANAQSSSAQSSMKSNLLDVMKLNGTQVKNLQGQELGKLKQVLVDPQSGRARYAVIEVEKAVNPDNSEIAVPFTALQFSGKAGDANFHVALDATKEKLQNAPKTKVGEADRLYSKESSEPIYSYWAIMWFDDNDASNSAAGHQKGSGKSGTASSSSSAQPSNPSATTGATSRSNDRPNVSTGTGSGSGSGSATSGSSGTSGSTTPPTGSGSSTTNPSGATTGTPK